MKEPHVATLDVPYTGYPGQTHRVTYYTWGNDAAPPVLCVHGLARNGRDFDFLADILSADFRVIAIDMPGRGLSQWLVHPEEYNLAAYMLNLLFFLDVLKIGPVHWIGTSMGGLLGMMMAAGQPERVRTLVLNDVGARVPGVALARLAEYVGVAVRFASRAEAEKKLREIYVPFGITREEVWQHLFAHSFEELPDGGVRMAYDPAIGAPMNKDPAQADAELWPVWQQVRCPVLLIHGATSDILTDATIEQMRATHPGMELHTVPGVGHAPMLTEEAEITRIHRWLKPAA